jgi:hypothetical protein
VERACAAYMCGGADLPQPIHNATFQRTERGIAADGK